MTRKSNKKESLINTVNPHKSHITTSRNWDVYAREKGLPSAVTLINHFGSWNSFKDELGLPKKQSKVTTKELIKVAEQHKGSFTSKREWNDYALQHGLPSSSTYIKHFGSWNNVKNELDLSLIKTNKKPLYTKEDIKNMLLTHGKNLENRTQWDVYAKENKLPTYKTIIKHFSWEEVLQLAGKERKSYTEVQLIELMERHRDIFFYSSIKSWDKYAKEKDLPLSWVFIRKFGSWKKANIEGLKHLQSKKH